MTDRDDRGARQSLAQEPVGQALGGLVERGRGLVKKEPIGLEEDGAHDG